MGSAERLVQEGKCKAIGLSDVNVAKAKEIFEAATIKRKFQGFLRGFRS